MPLDGPGAPLRSPGSRFTNSKKQAMPHFDIRHPVDLIVHPRWIIPMDGGPKVLEDHSLVIEGAEILDICPRVEANARYRGESELRLPGHVLIPGLINAHGHAAMSLLRGYADDLPLQEWLNEQIWPAEARLLSPEFVKAGTELAIIEMIRGGTTCFSDQYFFAEAAAEAVDQLGIRAQLACPILDFATPWAEDAETAVELTLALAERYRSHPRIRVALGPHAPYTLGNESLQMLIQTAREEQLPVQMHIHETAQEVSDASAQYGCRPLARLQQLGLINDQLQAVHMTQLSEEEIRLLAAAGSSVVHCPESNLKLASGIAPVTELTKAGVNVALGTDGAASNNDLDLLGEMRTAALLAKGISGDARAVSAYQALQMATLNGARALGIEDFTGSLEKGKQADFALIDLSAPATQPVHDPLSQVVYSASRDQVTHLFVAGEPLMIERELIAIDEHAILEQARHWQQKLAEH